MTAVAPSSDADLLNMLRVEGPLHVTEMAKAAEVTQTAIRQRLSRLMGQGLIQREAVRIGRGRPKHRYQLTQKGLRLTGSNFPDLALALWREIGSIEDLAVRRDVITRVVRAMAARYVSQIDGETTADRMESISELLSQRRLAFNVDRSGELPVLTAHACPYPGLADEDRGICTLEKLLYSELLGRDVELSHCRLDGEGPCQFRPA
jgi:predicted ArsR family transcriptional regulator